MEEKFDPRIQIELERLNSTTNKINELEVDLDEAKSHFRELLKSSTSEIESYSKKLGSSITKVRPYYDARIKSKKALQEMQKAALNYEKAVSAHAAAKEMVYLAEEGLKAEGRTFDQAWQEMLNHATMRVNESEIDRSKCEMEHKKTFQDYHLAEIRVLELQKELKKAIAKSRPFFEMKIHYCQLLESQKMKVKNLEKLIAENKFTYSCTLRNLERISDEIHKARKKRKKCMKIEKFDKLENIESSNSDIEHWQNNCFKNHFEIKKDFMNDSHNRIKNESLVQQVKLDLASFVTINCFSSIDSIKPDNEILNISGNLKNKRSFSQTEIFSNLLSNQMGGSDSKSYSTEYLDLYVFDKRRLSGRKHSSLFPSEENESYEFLKKVNDYDSSEVKVYQENNIQRKHYHSEATKINPNSKGQEILTTIFIKNSHGASQKSSDKENNDYKNTFCLFERNNLKKKEETFISENCDSKTLTESSKSSTLKREKFDVLWNGSTKEKVKGLLSQSLIKLNIGSLAEKSLREKKTVEENKIVCYENKNFKKNLSGNNEIYLNSREGTNNFNQKNFKKEEHIENMIQKKTKTLPSNSKVSFQTIFKSKREKLFMKNAPSPLEKTLIYLNANEDSNSDSDSLASCDLLTDEQLSSLVLDRDLEEIYEDLI